MKLIKLTEPNGDPVYINLEQICCLSKEGYTNYTKIRYVDGIQIVKESVDEILEMLK